MRKLNSIAVLKAAAIATLALIVGSAGAQQTAVMQSYDIELVVFRTLSSNATPEAGTRDMGTANQPLLSSDDDSSATGAAIESAPIATATETFPPLATGKFQLTAIADTLRRSRNYQPLAHFGWTQPGFPRTEAHYMSIDSQAAAGAGLSGRVAVSRGRYLHLTLDLVYEPPGEPGQRYVLRQTRRMRSNERHYIDHPKLGVIAVIRQSEQ
jgi:hypothetical protein